MSSPAQVLANQSNAQKSTGPVTPEGKARVSQNAAKFGLFSACFVRPGEAEEFAGFTAAYLADLSPQTVLEETLAREVVHAAWRLRRCAAVESAPPEDATAEDLDRLQASVDRARASAQRSIHRSLAELRRVQTERVYRTIALPPGFDSENLGQTSCRQLDPAALFIKQVAAEDAQAMNDVIESYRRSASLVEHDSAKQTQSRPIAGPSVPRNAPCPCGSREKYKRCCGKTAPPVLSTRAA